jgi:transcriptional/translational regulatory protein YebC/TACO1
LRKNVQSDEKPSYDIQISTTSLTEQLRDILADQFPYSIEEADVQKQSKDKILITVDVISLSEVSAQINESQKARFEGASSSTTQVTISSSNTHVTAQQYSISDLISLVDPDDEIEVTTSASPSEPVVSLEDSSDLEKLLLERKKNLLVSSLLG